MRINNDNDAGKDDDDDCKCHDSCILNFASNSTSS